MTRTDHELALAHKYTLDGKALVNVTAVSGLLDNGKSAAFAGAAVKLTKEGLNYRDEWRERGERGTRVHGHCESFLRGEAIDCLPSDMGFVDAVESFIKDRDPYVLELEEIVLCEAGYGGRFDLIAVLDNETWLIDLKTGKQYPTEHTLQLSAYRYANGIAVYNADGSLNKLRPLPEIDRTGCLYVAEDGTYKLVEYPAGMNAYGVFLGLLAAYQWDHSPEIKELTKAARS